MKTNRGRSGRSCSVAPSKRCSVIGCRHAVADRAGKRKPQAIAPRSIVSPASPRTASTTSCYEVAAATPWASKLSCAQCERQHAGGDRPAGNARNALEPRQLAGFVEPPQRADVEEHRAIAAAREAEGSPGFRTPTQAGSLGSAAGTNSVIATQAGILSCFRGRAECGLWEGGCSLRRAYRTLGYAREKLFGSAIRQGVFRGTIQFHLPGRVRAARGSTRSCDCRAAYLTLRRGVTDAGGGLPI